MNNEQTFSPMNNEQTFSPMNMLGGMYDNYQLREIVNIFREGKGIKGKSVSILYILLMLAIKHYLSKTEEIINPIKNFMKTIFFSLFYRTVTYKDGNGTTLDDMKISIIDNTRIDNIIINKYLPIYHVDNDNSCELYYVKYIHDSFEQDINEDAEKQYNDLISRSKKNMGGNIFKVERDLVVRPTYPSTLFPSDNYINLNNCVSKFIKVCKINKSYNVLGLLVDGEPGLGKTKFSDFAVVQGDLKKVIRLDMTIVKDTMFDTIINKIYTDPSLESSTMFVIDELDKYIQYRIDKTYYELQDKNVNNKKVDGNTEIAIPSIEDHTKRMKLNFLYSILSILEKDGLKAPCIVMFCSNNFDTIFEGIDEKHFKSLKDRFTNFRFNRCEKDEIIRYLTYYNNNFKGTEFYEENIQILVKELRNDISITYRSLNHISIKKAYDIKSIIYELNTFEENNIKDSKYKENEIDDLMYEENGVSVVINKVHSKLVDKKEDDPNSLSTVKYVIKKHKLRDTPTINYNVLNKDEQKRKTSILNLFNKKLVEIKNTIGSDNKFKIAKELFELIAHPDYKLINSKIFNKSIIDKYNELIKNNIDTEKYIKIPFDNVRFMLEANC